jgi:3'(2'), 5'-bisphosphate nucleotidase
MTDLTMTLRRLAIEAGAAIMEIYYGAADLELQSKSDDSPLTAADLAADRIICDGLAAAFPDIPVVTEERADGHAEAMPERHFLVDPLDGTKEFIQRRGEFTVNIALIDAGRPVAGVVYAPAIGRLFRTNDAGGAVEETIVDGESDGAHAIHAAKADNAALRVVASKSHRDAETDAYISRYAVAAFKSAGSSLKFCLVAAGEADLYPRLGPTMEWDTAAGHAVLRAAGGLVVRHADGASLDYGHPGRRNPSFIAASASVHLTESRE